MKRKIYITLILCVIISIIHSCIVFPSAVEVLIYGDINADGIVDVVDIIVVRSYIVSNRTTFDKDALSRADINLDDNIDIVDVVMLRKAIVSGETLNVWHKNDSIIVNEPIKADILDADLCVYTADTLPAAYYSYDFDCDGLTNEEEIKYGTDIYNSDSDGDGLTDYDEIYNIKTDPAKWSTNNDGVSDLEYSLINIDEFTEGYTATDRFGLKYYIAAPQDNLHITSKVSTDVFNDLDTISESYQIKSFSGKIAVDCSRYDESVANSIVIYKSVNGKAEKVSSVVTKEKLVEFIVEENDIFVLVYAE